MSHGSCGWTNYLCERERARRIFGSMCTTLVCYHCATITYCLGACVLTLSRRRHFVCRRSFGGAPQCSPALCEGGTICRPSLCAERNCAACAQGASVGDHQRAQGATVWGPSLCAELYCERKWRSSLRAGRHGIETIALRRALLRGDRHPAQSCTMWRPSFAQSATIWRPSLCAGRHGVYWDLLCTEPLCTDPLICLARLCVEPRLCAEAAYVLSR